MSPVLAVQVEGPIVSLACYHLLGGCDGFGTAVVVQLVIDGLLVQFAGVGVDNVGAVPAQQGTVRVGRGLGGKNNVGQHVERDVNGQHADTLALSTVEGQTEGGDGLVLLAFFPERVGPVGPAFLYRYGVPHLFGVGTVAVAVVLYDGRCGVGDVHAVVVSHEKLLPLVKVGL